MSLHKIRFFVSPGALIVLALAFYFCEPGFILAFLTAATVHELGHLLALRLAGLCVSSLLLEPGGLCISYSGVCGAVESFVAALSGPAAGLLWAFAASELAIETNIYFFSLSSGISLVLSLFNLLPLLPLDGGRVMIALLELTIGRGRGERCMLVSGIVFLCCFLATGLILALNGRGLALLLAAAILSVSFYRENMSAGLLQNSWVL